MKSMRVMGFATADEYQVSDTKRNDATCSVVSRPFESLSLYECRARVHRIMCVSPLGLRSYTHFLLALSRT